MKNILLCVFVFSIQNVFAQSLEQKLADKESQLAQIKLQEQNILSEIEDIKLDQLIVDIKSVGLPTDDFVVHEAMILSYSQEHKQPKWVMHKILPEIITGDLSRSNDFRVDPLVVGGTAVQEDYFLVTVDEKGQNKYDGFGFDRGHLAPSADFRWSEKGLSESYMYSNISPQLGAFNRGIWKDLEAAIRNYIYQNPQSNLYVITLPILQEGLETIPRSKVNKVSIPKQFIKVAIDLKTERGIAFLMENKDLKGALQAYAITIDEAEAISGYDFFANIDDDIENKLEAKLNIDDWYLTDKSEQNEVIEANTLNKGQYNTQMAKQKYLSGKQTEVCGTLVAHRKSKKGHYWANLDAAYPNADFSFWIRKENIINFPVLPHSNYMDRKICVNGKLNNFGDNTNIEIKSEKAIKKFEPKT